MLTQVACNPVYQELNKSRPYRAVIDVGNIEWEALWTDDKQAATQIIPTLKHIII